MRLYVVNTLKERLNLGGIQRWKSVLCNRECGRNLVGHEPGPSWELKRFHLKHFLFKYLFVGVFGETLNRLCFSPEFQPGC